MPLRKNVPWEERDRDIASEGDTAWMHDDKTTLAKRVKQLMTGIHWAEEPLSRVSHLITNVRLADTGDAAAGDAEFTVKCRFFVYRNRLETETDFLVGRREDRLRRVDGQLRFARRKIILEQSVLMAKNLTVFL
jgi:3-phenylpropionate/cinnamic acid dioxygenase small subunit